MERLWVDASNCFRVDRCVSCQYVWLDRGEWQALVEQGLDRVLDTLLSDAGQKKIQQERMQALRTDALRQRHGNDCIDEVLRIRRWLVGQTHRDEVLALISTADAWQP